MRVTHSSWRMSSPVLAEEPEAARPLVPLEDLGRPVVGPVVRRDDEVDAGVQVERDLRVDDVRLVAGEQRHDELHARPIDRCRRAPSSAVTASSMNAGATGVEYSAAAGTASDVPRTPGRLQR